VKPTTGLKYKFVGDLINVLGNSKKPKVAIKDKVVKGKAVAGLNRTLATAETSGNSASSIANKVT